MGAYTQLDIGRIRFEWKNMIPSFLCFLFKDEEIFVQDFDIERARVRKFGFKTTVGECRDRLDKLGYSMKSFCYPYSYFRSGLFNVYYGMYSAYVDIKFQKLTKNKRERKIKEHFGLGIGIEDELLLFSRFINTCVNQAINGDDSGLIDLVFMNKRYKFYLKQDFVFKFGDTVSVEFENIESSFSHNMDERPYCLQLVGSMFSEDNYLIYPEILNFISLRILLDGANDSERIVLDVSDMYYDVTEEEVAGNLKVLHKEMVHEIHGKIELYNKTFSSLLTNDESIREANIKTICKSLITQCKSEKKIKEKGHLLEELLVTIFTQNKPGKIFRKHLSTRDEEIDIAIENDLDRQFWRSYVSPLFFIECKNWIKKVGAPEIRDFEGKLSNHHLHSKLGYIVAANGFTSGAKDAVKRISRDKYLIVLVTLQDIEDYLYSDRTFSDWLADLTIRLN